MLREGVEVRANTKRTFHLGCRLRIPKVVEIANINEIAIWVNTEASSITSRGELSAVRGVSTSWTVPEKSSDIGEFITWFQWSKCKDSLLGVLTRDISPLVAPQNCDTRIATGILLIVVNEFLVLS
jgi:hypothetical protein